MLLFYLTFVVLFEYNSVFESFYLGRRLRKNMSYLFTQKELKKNPPQNEILSPKFVKNLERKNENLSLQK